MTSTTERPIFPKRMPKFFRWSKSLLFIAGGLTLGYVGFILLDAHLYQASAKQSLQIKIEAGEDRTRTHLKPVKNGDVLGRMDIPRLGMSIAVLQGTSSRVLRRGAGHVAGTPLPGEAGNVGIAGHRDTFFRGLKDVQKNDEIQLQTATGLFRYEVDWVRVVAPDDIAVLAPSTESALTLVTCYPFYLVGPAPSRFVVHARKI
jgi:sortase A